MTAPSSQQQAAITLRPHYQSCDFPDHACSCGAAEDRPKIAAALDAARADEAARWRAKIEALASEFERSGGDDLDYAADRLRALLGGERR